MPELLTSEDAELLLKLCQTGQLYRVAEWIDSGKSLEIPPELKKTPLTVALKTGFHSLVELLLRHENNQAAKNGALASAVSQRRLDLVKLLVRYGTEINSVPLSNVLLEWEPDVMRFFLDNGADAITGFPFADAFGERIRTALGPYLEYKRSHPELASQLQEHADMALRQFCHDGNLKWISLLTWAGADPRTLGPRLDYREEWEDDPEMFTTGLQEACTQGHLDVLKKLKLDPARDNLGELLNCASLFANEDVIRYLLDLGADPNDKPNGASSSLDKCIGYFRLESFPEFMWYGPKHQIPRYAVYRTRGSIRELVERGAIWAPDDRSRMNDVRRTLYRLEPDCVLEFITILTKNKACSKETMTDLLRTPRMRQHLETYEKQLQRLGLSVTRQRQKKTKKSKGQEPVKTQDRPPSWYLLSKYNRKQLYEEVWSEPIQKLARKYGLSDVGLAKVCRKLNIPRPGRGYWAKKATGRPVRKQPPLAPLKH